MEPYDYRTFLSTVALAAVVGYSAMVIVHLPRLYTQFETWLAMLP
jgi:hypothetical protein